jgi:hypothetical protein
MESKSESAVVNETVECSHLNVNHTRCHLHYGWCGTCSDCGQKVHARMAEFRLTGKMVFRKTSFHGVVLS